MRNEPLLKQLRWVDGKLDQKHKDAPPFADLVRLEDAGLIRVSEFVGARLEVQIEIMFTGLGRYELKRLEAVHGHPEVSHA